MSGNFLWVGPNFFKIKTSTETNEQENIRLGELCSSHGPPTEAGPPLVQEGIYHEKGLR